jgi:hypothetical protein
LKHSSLKEKNNILNRFLVKNSELEELTTELSIFNIFKILKIEKTEIRHSNVLAWLLNPLESHGFTGLFVKRFLSTILLESEYPPFQPASIELMNFQDLEVMREWKNIDLLAISKANRLIILIENKIKASVSDQQLSRYLITVKEEYPKHKIIPVLLTLYTEESREDAEKTGYNPWSHEQMYQVVNQIYNQRFKNMSSDTKIFLEHYLAVLRRITMQDKKLITLCKSIYKKHKDAIDLIVEYGMTSQFQTAAETFILDKNDMIQLSSRSNAVWFIPKNWKRKMPTCGNGWGHLSEPYPIACRFKYWQGESIYRIGFIIEVGPMENNSKRLKLVEAFQKKDFKIGTKAFRQEAKYTRVHSTYVRISDPDDYDQIYKHLGDLLQKSQSALKDTTKIIDEFKW